MNAMLLERVAPVQTHPLVPRDLPAPQPGPGQVRLRVRCCAVCRTDLHIIEGELPAHRCPWSLAIRSSAWSIVWAPGASVSRSGGEWAWRG